MQRPRTRVRERMAGPLRDGAQRRRIAFSDFLFRRRVAGGDDFNRLADVLGRMFGHYLHAVAGRALGDCGIFDQIGEQASVRQTAADQPRDRLGAHLDANDR